MTTNAYAAKRALFDRLGQLAQQSGHPLSGVQVAYLFPRDAKAQCIFGGGVSFDQPDEQAVEDGYRRIPHEAATIIVVIRVRLSPIPSDGHEASDIRCEELGEALGQLLAQEPNVCGGGSVARVVSGRGDYDSEDEAVVSMLAYRIRVESDVT